MFSGLEKVGKLIFFSLTCDLDCSSNSLDLVLRSHIRKEIGVSLMPQIAINLFSSD